MEIILIIFILLSVEEANKLGCSLASNIKESDGQYLSLLAKNYYEGCQSVASLFCYGCRMVHFSDLAAVRDWKSHLGNIDCAHPPEDGAGLDLVKCPVMDVTQACVYITFNITGSVKKGAPTSTAYIRTCASMKQLGCRALTEHELKEKRHEMDAIKGAYHTLGDDSLPLGGRICTCRTNRCRPDVMNFRLPLQQADLPKHLTVTDNSYFSMTLHRKWLWILPHIFVIIGATVLLMTVFSLCQRKRNKAPKGGMFGSNKKV